MFLLFNKDFQFGFHETDLNLIKQKKKKERLGLYLLVAFLKFGLQFS